MSKKSRLNPNKASRLCLKELQGKGILAREKVGLPHLLKPDGTVEDLGYDRGCPWDNRYMPNFYPTVARAERVLVQYKGQRVELTATMGLKDWTGHVLAVGTHFPRNDLATDLLAAAGGGSWEDVVVDGDAVLVTDKRMHWVFRAYRVAVDFVEMLDAMLSTPRDLIKEGNRASIFFHKEPCQSDLVTLKMRWM
jgi:hypothetical protein